MRSKSVHVAKPAIIAGRLIIIVAQTMCLLSEFKKNAIRRFKRQNYSEKSERTNGQSCANYRRITVVKLSPCQQRALLRLRPSQQTATFYGIQPDAQFQICDEEWHRNVVTVGISCRERRPAVGKTAVSVSRLLNPLYVSLLRFSSLTQPQSRCQTPQHCFYFRYSPLLPSQSPCIDTLYRWLRWINVISVHICALNAILGGADKLRKASLPLVSDRLLPSWRTAPLSLPPSSLYHTHTQIPVFLSL